MMLLLGNEVDLLYNFLTLLLNLISTKGHCQNSEYRSLGRARRELFLLSHLCLRISHLFANPLLSFNFTAYLNSIDDFCRECLLT